MTWTAETSLGNEAGKIRWELVEYTNGTGLDLGCGISRLSLTSLGWITAIIGGLPGLMLRSRPVRI